MTETWGEHLGAHTAPQPKWFLWIPRLRLSQFIKENIEPILVEWEAFARTMVPPAHTMSVATLRDHAEQILLAIAKDMESAQTETQRDAKSKGLALPLDARETSATAHGVMRQLVGFDLNQLGAELRAVRATVLRLWKEQVGVVDAAVEEISRFNEGVDQALAEALSSHATNVANSRDTFLAILGHDLRTPLGALSGCLHLLRKAEGPADTKERAFQIATRSIVSIDQMITDLLEYTRTRLGRGIEVVPGRGDFAALCHEAFEEVRAAYPRRALVSAISGDLSAMFDAPRMRQVLINLLTNAVQHSDHASPVFLVVKKVGDRIEAVVKNRGTPIPPDSLQVIFNPLVQVARTESKPHERPATSLGLGLFIAREIVTAHGGSVEVTSSAADGTAFAVHLDHGSDAEYADNRVQGRATSAERHAAQGDEVGAQVRRLVESRRL